MGKSWPHNVASNCLYLFVWVSLCILLILFFKPCFCNGPETELKWKTGIENLLNVCILSYTDSWCLVPFSSDISCDVTHIVRLYYDYGMLASKLFISSEIVQSGVEYTASELLYEARRHKQNSCNGDACQSEWGFGLEFVDEHFECNGMTEGSCEGKARVGQLLKIKTNIQRFRRVQTG